MQPLISIIIVTYNAANYLQNAIDSVVNQTYKNIELIIIDGESTDQTVNIIKNNGPKITFWKTEKDNGIYDAMNKAVKFCKGDFYLFLGADDILYNTLHEVIHSITNLNCLYYGNVYFEKDKTIYDGPFDSKKIVIKNICHQAILYPKAVFDKYTYNLKYKIRADHYLNLQCFVDKDIEFQYIPITIAQFSAGGTSSSAVDKEFNNDRLTFIKTHFNSRIYYYCRLRSLLSQTLKKLPN
jgi:glycosyltransferase involved in cell wall biosynthesis